LNPQYLASWLNVKRASFTVDRFASYYNAQLPRFNSHLCNPGSEAVDATVLLVIGMMK